MNCNLLALQFSLRELKESQPRIEAHWAVKVSQLLEEVKNSVFSLYAEKSSEMFDYKFHGSHAEWCGAKIANKIIILLQHLRRPGLYNCLWHLLLHTSGWNSIEDDDQFSVCFKIGLMPCPLVVWCQLIVDSAAYSRYAAEIQLVLAAVADIAIQKHYSLLVVAVSLHLTCSADRVTAAAAATAEQYSAVQIVDLVAGIFHLSEVL
ncbi:hypothetical protein Ancab_013936 [Ancistrocladus abbreviatus]